MEREDTRPMAGTIRKRGSSHQALLSWRDPDTHKSVQVSVTRKTKKDAELALADLIVKHDQNVLVVSHHTFADLAAKYMTVVAPNKAYGTREGMERSLRLYLLPAMGHLPLKRLTPIIIDQLYRDLLHHGLSPNTIRAVHARLSTICNQGVKWGMLAVAPTSRATPPPASETPFAVVTPQQAQGLIKAAGPLHPCAGPYLRTVLATGARRGEVCAIQRDDVDLARAELSITKSAYVAKGQGTVIGPPKTKASKRIVPLDPTTMTALVEHFEWMDKTLAAIGVMDQDPGRRYVFSASADFSKPLATRTANHWFDRSKAVVGLEGVRLHDLRHTMITTLLNAGMSVPAVGGRAGQASASITLHYGHRTPESDRRAADIMGDFLGEGESSG